MQHYAKVDVLVIACLAKLNHHNKINSYQKFPEILMEVLGPAMAIERYESQVVGPMLELAKRFLQQSTEPDTFPQGICNVQVLLKNIVPWLIRHTQHSEYIALDTLLQPICQTLNVLDTENLSVELLREKPLSCFRVRVRQKERAKRLETRSSAKDLQTIKLFFKKNNMNEPLNKVANLLTYHSTLLSMLQTMNAGAGKISKKTRLVVVLVTLHLLLFPFLRVSTCISRFQ